MTDSHENSDAALRRIRWSCRRGMLELDLILLSFLEGYYSQLSIWEQKVFAILLEYPDPELYGYLIGEKICGDPEQQALLDTIRREVRC